MTLWHICLSQHSLIFPSISPCLHNTIPKYLNSFTSSFLSPRTTLHLPIAGTHPKKCMKVNQLYFSLFKGITFSFLYVHTLWNLSTTMQTRQSSANRHATTAHPIPFIICLAPIFSTLAFIFLIHSFIKISQPGSCRRVLIVLKVDVWQCG